ncbi:LruC domain-containing protein [Ferrimonas futtsuensis]|uniref:LruC domain-containing protein n=1 Tax=Ferrimonas futtsuensis TaxID=364764 RepID=UPI000400D158|nr:LruC domain-containing protein [Ferrimonas futtsuensis]
MTRIATLLLTVSTGVAATPFENCPTEAFLFQKDTTVYGVDLVTGDYEVLKEDLTLAGNVNAIGFNQTDNYIYGFSKSQLKVVRVGGDYEAQVLNVSGLPSGVHFYVGDVTNNTYWIYHKNHGLYAISLSASDPNYLKAVKIPGADTSMNLTDFAFHPDDGELYAVDNGSGAVYQIDTSDGSREILGYGGVTGTFGAGYFDKSGYYYISRNQDGNIFRLDLRNPEQLDPTAEFYANGPSSNQNDGARCAIAPVVADNVDFGDAPDSYGTTMEENGARHSLEPQGPMLGSKVDAESDGYKSPRTDESVGLNDEDGISFKNGLTAGQAAIIGVSVSRQAGYLQGFFDWNSDGDFDDAGEHAVQDEWLAVGSSDIQVTVPAAASGVVQTRFRIASDAGVRSRGGAPDGEVEDYAEAVLAPGVTQIHYPSSGWATVAFEDRWPRMPDYDMNDVVVDLKFTQYLESGQITRVKVTGQLRAVGAAYHNGLALHLPGISRTNIGSGSTLTKSGSRVEGAGLEAGQSNAVFVVSEDLKTEYVSSCLYYRTEQGCNDEIQMPFELDIQFAQGVPANAMPRAPFDPFIFASPGKARTGFDAPPGRALEIHMADFPPTDLASDQYFGREQDDSNPGSGRYYRTGNSLPWALEFNHQWSYPAEQQDLLQTYPNFEKYLEYDGGQYTDWHQKSNGVQQKLFD